MTALPETSSDRLTATLDACRKVFIINISRSGSYLIHSLFDGHPEILTIPFDFNFYKSWPRTAPRDTKDKEEFIRHYFASSNLRYPLHGVFNYSYGYLGTNRDAVIKFDPERMFEFTRDYLQGRELTRGSFFMALHYAFARLRQRESSPLKAIVEMEHGSSRCSDLLAAMGRMTEDHPDCRFLISIRDPRSTLHSVKKNWRNTFFSGHAIGGEFHHLMLVMEEWLAVEHMIRILPADRIRFVRFEDMHRRPEETVRGLADWLSLSWAPSLMESTLDGMPWWGNSGEGKPVSGFSAGRAAPAWESGLMRDEIDLIETLLEPTMTLFGYEVPSRHRATLAWNACTFRARELMCYRDIFRLMRRHLEDIRERTTLFRGTEVLWSPRREFWRRLRSELAHLFLYPLVKPAYWLTFALRIRRRRASGAPLSNPCGET